MPVSTNAISITAARGAWVSQAVTPWQVNATSADASGCEEIVATPGTGYHLVISRLIIYIGAAITVTVGSGETGPGSVEGDKIGPLGGAAGTYVLDVREHPVLLTANKSLTFDASGPGTVCIYVEGFTRAA
jgi:hypothetical protein